MANPQTQTPEKPGFTESFTALETILEKFRAGSLTLEESLVLFETGIGHVKVCQDELNRAKGKVEELVKTLQDGGEMVTKPFDAQGE